MSIRLLAANSLTEAKLHFSLTMCPHCQNGSLSFILAATEEIHVDARVRLDGHCGLCERSASLHYRIEPEYLAELTPPAINPTDLPSRIVDVGQWLLLYRQFFSIAQDDPDKTNAWENRYLAGLCLDEMLKFYVGGADLPPGEAFFDESRRRQFQQHPEVFLRPILLHLRAGLPQHRNTQAGRSTGRPGKWWQFWR